MRKTGLDAVSALQEGLASQVYDMTQLKVFSPERHMQEGESLMGRLTMVEDYEKFEFVAQAKEQYTRNPIIWHGDYLNVHRDKQGNYQANFRRMTIGNLFNPTHVANAIYMELITAKRVLGL